MTSDPSAAQKQALVVLGMHRSGTSAMARVLSLSGARLPANLMDPGSGNTPGHWEPVDVQEFNDEVLGALDSDWSDTFGPRQAHQRKPPTKKYIPAARALIEANYGGEDFIVLKEPRISILMDLWKEALAQEGYSASFVIMVRHPLEVAKSLKVRNGLVENRSLLLWASYMMSCEVGTRKFKRIFVKFDDLLSNAEGVLDRMETELDVQFPKRTWQSALAIQEFLNTEERHHHSGEVRDIAGFGELTRLYEYFEAASQGASMNTDVSEETLQWLGRLEQTVGPVLKKVELDLKASRAEAEEARRDAAAVKDQLTDQLAAVAAERQDLAGRFEDADADRRDLAERLRETEELRHEAARQLEAISRETASQRQQLEAALDDVTQREIDLRERLARSMNELTNSQAQTAEVEQALWQLQEEHLPTLGRLAAEASSAQARAAELEQALAAAHASAIAREAEFIDRFNDAATQIRVLNQRAEDMAGLLAEARSLASAREAELANQLSAAEAEAVDARTRADGLEVEAVEARYRANNLEADAADARARANDLEISMNDLQARLTRQEIEFAAQIALKTADSEDLRRASAALSGSLSQTNAALTEARALLADRTVSLSDANSLISRLNGELSEQSARGAVELMSARDQSAELARALSEAVIAREQFEQAPPLDLLWKAFRRFFSRSWLG